MQRHDVVIIGAGLAGLVAAQRLGEAERTVLLVDKGRSVGGRLATRRIGDATLDHGAQFFTTRSDEFTEAVASWIDRGVVAEWSHGFNGNDGYPRYRSEGGMNQLAKHLRQALPPVVDVLTSTSVSATIPDDDGFVVTYDGASREPDQAAAVIVSSPVPQSLEILSAGGVLIPPELAEGLGAIRYHKVVCLMATISEPAPFGDVGALQRPDDPVFTFCADNSTKGISSVPAVTFHAAHDLSEMLWSLSDREIIDRLQPEAGALLGPAAIRSIQVKKWRFAGPVEPWPDRCVTIGGGPAPLTLCGDAFGGPKIEGAFLSGSAAAEATLERIG